MTDKIELNADDPAVKIIGSTEQAQTVIDKATAELKDMEPVPEGTEARTYVTRTVEREAIRWTGDNADAVKAFVGTVDEGYNKNQEVFSYDPDAGATVGRLWVAANREWLTLDVGEWIIKDSHGFYPCKNDVFHEKYMSFEDLGTQDLVVGQDWNEGQTHDTELLNNIYNFLRSVSSEGTREIIARMKRYGFDYGKSEVQ